MASREWLRSAHEHGYDSGEITSKEPDARRAHEEAKIGGSYYDVFQKAIQPFVGPNSRVLELGPGRGSWTRAILSLVPNGEVHTIDLHDVTRFMDPSNWPGRLHCHQVTENDYRFLPDAYFDFFFSFGVLCHLVREERREVLQQALPKVRPGGYSAHEYGDWIKLDAFGWIAGGMPQDLKCLPDDESWWPRNDAHDMALTARAAGWRVVTPDLDILRRDGIIILRRPKEEVWSVRAGQRTRSALRRLWRAAWP
jgi:SAM-dependent methyltransferase